MKHDIKFFLYTTRFHTYEYYGRTKSSQIPRSGNLIYICSDMFEPGMENALPTGTVCKVSYRIFNYQADGGADGLESVEVFIKETDR